MAQRSDGIGALPAANDVQRALLARETGSYVMTPAGPVPQQDPLLTEAQAAYFFGSLAPGAGALEASGGAPEYPSEDMTFMEMVRGPRSTSLPQNIEEGNYGTAVLQGLGLLGDAASVIPVVGPAAGAVLKAPRAIQKAGRLVRSTSDASDTFGKGAQEITLSDPVSGGRIKLLSRPGEPNSVLSLYVDEEFRGQGVGKALQDAALAEGPLMGQVSSKAAAVNAYRAGRRPADNPNASLEEVFAAIDRDSSVNMVTPDLLPSDPRTIQKTTRSASKPDLDTWGGKVDLERSLEQAEIIEKEAPNFSDALDLAGFLTERVDPEYAPIANRVRDRLEFMRNEQGFRFPLTVFNLKGNPAFGQLTHQVPKDVINPSTAGIAKLADFDVGVFLKGRDVAAAQGAEQRFGTDFETALHELIHAATLPSTTIGSKKMGGVPLSPKLFELHNDLAGLQGYLATHFNEIGKQAQALSAKNKKSALENVEHPLARAILGGKTNALKDLDETMAWGMSNPRVQKYLDSIPYEPERAAQFNIPQYDSLNTELRRRAYPVLDDRGFDLVEGMLKLNPEAKQFAEGGEVKKEGPSVWDAMVASVLKYLDLPPEQFPALKKLMEPKDVSRPLEDEEDG